LAQFLRTPQLYQILTDFQKYFTVRIRRKFVIILSLKIPPHLIRYNSLLGKVATYDALPLEATRGDGTVV